MKENIIPAGGTAKVSVNESIKMTDVPNDAGDVMGRYYERQMEYLKRYVEPHKKLSRFITDKDINIVLSEGKVMLELCRIPRGIYGNIAAIAHPQINDVDPLRFFVTAAGMLIINPVIINHTKTPIFKDEGCMSYPEELIKKVARYNKIIVEYQTLLKGEDGKPALSPVITEGYNGNIANVFQHEIGHLNGVYIYDKDYSAESSIGIPEEKKKETLDKTG